MDTCCHCGRCIPPHEFSSNECEECLIEIHGPVSEEEDDE